MPGGGLAGGEPLTGWGRECFAACMSEQGYPVTVEVRRPDGRVEQVRVGTAWRSGEGFTLRLGELTIGASEGAAAAAPAPRRASGGSGGSASAGEVATLPNYGRSKGAPIRGASMQDLEFYANGARRSLADPSKSRWHEREKALLASIEAEIARQRGESPLGDDDGPPPPGDDDFTPPF
jgi:hypothetical protein